MRHYRLGSHTKTDLKVHLIWIPKYRKKVLTGEIAHRAREVLRKTAMENDVEILSGKIACDHIHMFISYRPNLSISKIVQQLKGVSSHILMSEFPTIRKKIWGRHFWARGYLAVSSGNITDEMIQQYIDEQEGEPMSDNSRFQIDDPLNPST